MEYKGLHKSRPICSLIDLSTKRSQILNAERHEKRRQCFWGSKVALNESVSEKPQPVVKKKNPRAEMLLKWKAEKMKKLEEEKKKRKPIFKVGVVQRKITGSPLINQPKPYVKKKVGAEDFKPKVNDVEHKEIGILTRAKAKNMGIKPRIKLADKPLKSFNKCYKYEGGKQKCIESHVFQVPKVVSKLPCSGLTFPCSPKITKNKKFFRLEENELEKEKDISETQIKPEEETLEKAETKAVEEVKENNLDSCNVTTEAEQLKEFFPIYYSPYITVRSGRKSNRKSKKSLTIDVDEQIKKEENEFKCRIFSFRKYIECETKRLMVICNNWKHIYQEYQEIPTDVEGDIDSLIGKTNLLTSDKFMQFKELIDKCENGDPFVKVDDLQGFQDWVSIEVERIVEESYKLEKRKCNNWIIEPADVDVVKAQKKAVKNGTKKLVGKSKIRSHILAARKLLKEGNANSGEALELPTLELLKATPPKKNETLLKEVLTSETKKKNRSSSKKSPALRERRNSGLEIMIATQKNKFPTPVKKSPCFTDFEILIEKEDTPSNSILKKVPKILRSPKGHVRFENDNRNTVKRKRGLSEKYFQPLTDEEVSPTRTILGDLGNLSSTGMSTRSKTRQLSHSNIMIMNEQIN